MFKKHKTNLMKKFRITLSIALAMSAAFMSGCRMFGLELQKPYDYESGLGSNQLQTNCWEFLNSRSDLFEYFIEGVRYSGIDSAIFDLPGVTVFAPTQQAIGEAKSPATSGTGLFPGGYWDQHKVNNIKPDNWKSYPKEQVKEFILYHILQYPVSFDEFLSQTHGVRTFYPTMALDLRNDAYISLHMLSSAEAGRSDVSVGVILFVNDFASHYQKINFGTGTFTHANKHISPRTSNLRTKNGSYIHVMDHYLDFPTAQDLADSPIYKK